MGSPGQVAELCDVIQIFVSDGEALFDVIGKMSDKLTNAHVIVCNATVGPEATAEAARRVHERGAAFLDAPFTGSRSAAEKRALVYYVGGDEAVLKRVRPILEATSKAVVPVGEIGQAAAVKIATNMLVAVTVQTLAEVAAVLMRSGINPRVLGPALEHHAVRSGLVDMKLPGMLSGQFEPHFSLKHMFKDVQMAIHVANSLGIDIPTTTATAGVMYGCLNRGCGDLDFSVLAQIYGPLQPEEQPEEAGAPEAPGEEEAGPAETAEKQPESAPSDASPEKPKEAPSTEAAPDASGDPSKQDVVTSGDKGAKKRKKKGSSKEGRPQGEDAKPVDAGDKPAEPIHEARTLLRRFWGR